MTKIKLKITALSPLAIAGKKPGSVSQVEDHIPGSVIRGAIASHILQLSNQRTPNIAEQNLTEKGGDFATLFLSDEPAIFQNAYPAVAKKSESISQVVTDEIMVLPATAVSSKTKPGFKTNKGHGVFDTLIDRFCAEAYNFLYDPSCPQDLGRVEPFGGFYSKSKDNTYHSHSVSTRFLTRVGINRQRATSQDDILYSIEVLNESFSETPQKQNWQPVVYHSAIIVKNEEIAKSVSNFINNHSGIFRLGSATSRGLGKVDISATVEDDATDIEHRIKQFNEHLKSRWDLWSIFGNPENDLLENRIYFTLDLQSDAVLSGNWRRTTVISPKMLCEFAGLNNEFAQENFLKLEVAYTTYDYRSGWNAAWGLMKDIELVTNRGGVYLFSVDQEKEKLWIEKLKELELKGVGERTSEGFGQVQICNEFHLVLREEAV
jgi:CRISPR-associated protein Csx10